MSPSVLSFPAASKSVTTWLIRSLGYGRRDRRHNRSSRCRHVTPQARPADDGDRDRRKGHDEQDKA